MPNEQQLDAVISQFARQDPELFQELKDRIPVPSHEALEAATSAISSTAALPLETGAADERTELFGLETIVRPFARPVLTIRDNAATLEFLGQDSQVWAGRIQAAKPILDRIIPAVGRIEVTNHPDFDWVGTGWLVADDIIVTNRHVAREFGRSAPNGFTFRTGINGGTMTSRIDFLEEDQRLTSFEFTVNSVLYIAGSGEPDVAFLRVVRPVVGRPLPPPIQLADAIAADDFVATIGYPARDSRVPDQDLVLRIFGDVYDKKRLAPGQIIVVDGVEVQHDCSTLGGNSGSPLINLISGQAVGLHFSGLYMQANFAVSAPKVKDLLKRVQQGELPGAISVKSAGASSSNGVATSSTVNQGSYTFHLSIPIEVTVKVGAAVPVSAAPVAGIVAGEDLYENALATAREALAGNPDVTEVRLGYRFKRGWITDERVIVVEVKKKLSVTELKTEGKALIPPQFIGVGVDVRTAALVDQLTNQGVDLEMLEAIARPGRYREPTNISLTPVKEHMRAIFHVSPDSGFPNLNAFLGRVQRHLTATMYEWEPNHISDAIEAAMQGNNKSLRMVTQRQGTIDAVSDMQQRLGQKFKHVWASVGSDKLIPKSYHIKVASRDGEEIWMSSGNWKDSNQAPIDPAGENSTLIGPLRNHNREWHVIVANRTLATMFQRFIEFDFREAERIPLEEGLEPILPEVFVPEEAFIAELEKAVVARYFDPLIIDRELEIQPLLTPDRDARGNRVYMEHATKMIRDASSRIYLENQSFNLLEDDNNDEFTDFFGVLRDKQSAGLDVRIIFRDGREFGAGNAVPQQKLLERIRDFGIDTDFVRVQRKCHTKGIIVDSKEVMIGSHNLTNYGSLFNRDASMLVRDPEVAKYFEKIFRFDWDTLATQEADELVGGMRIARPGEETPIGMRRVSLAEVLGEN